MKNGKLNYTILQNMNRRCANIMLDIVHCLKCIWELQLTGCHYVWYRYIKAMVAIETRTFKLGTTLLVV